MIPLLLMSASVLLLFIPSELVSPRQTSIYVMCPWDHDIYFGVGESSISSLAIRPQRANIVPLRRRDLYHHIIDSVGSIKPDLPARLSFLFP